MSQHEVLLGELQMYSDSLIEWSEKLKEVDVCSQLMSVSDDKDEILKRYNLCKSLTLRDQQFQTQLLKQATGLLKLMNKLQDMVNQSEDLREVFEKDAEKRPLDIKITPAAEAPKAAAEEPPAKKVKKASKKNIKLNPIDCLMSNDVIM